MILRRLPKIISYTLLRQQIHYQNFSSKPPQKPNTPSLQNRRHNGFPEAKSIRSLLLPLESPQSNISMKHFSEILEQLIRHCDRIAPWDNIRFVNFQIKKWEPQEYPIQTLQNICGLTPYLMQFEGFFNRYFYNLAKVVEDHVLERPDKFSNLTLIRFMQFANVMGRLALLEKLNKIFFDRIENVSNSDLAKYLKHLTQRKLPSGIQRAIFKIIIQNLRYSVSEIPIHRLISIYSSLKQFNPYVFNTNEVISEIQKILIEQIDTLDEKLIIEIFTYQREDNPFYEIVLEKIEQSITQQNISSFSITFIHKFLYLISKHEGLLARNQLGSSKIKSYLIKNSEESNIFYSLIKNNFFSPDQLTELHKKVLANPQSLSRENQVYYFEMRDKGIAKLEQYRNFFPSQSIKTIFGKFTHGLTSKTVNLALIVHQLYNFQPQNQEILFMKQKIQENVKNVMQLDEVRVPIRINCSDSTIKFNELYGKAMIQNYIQDIMKGIKLINMNLLKYLMCANDFNTISRILTVRDQQLQILPFKTLLLMLLYRPSHFRRSLQFVNKTLYFSKFNLYHKFVATYLCNWDIHCLLHASDVGYFMKLGIKSLNSEFFISFMDYILYFIYTPCKFIKLSIEYVSLLNEIQNIEINTTKIHFTNVLTIVGQQLMKYNQITQIYALKLNAKCSDKLKQYTDLILNNGVINFNENQVNQDNMIIFVKSKLVTEQTIAKKQCDIIKIIKECDCGSLQSFVLNFGMNKNDGSTRILNMLLKQLAKRLYDDSQAEFKIELILQYLSSRKIQCQGYAVLLNSITNHYEKKANFVPLGVLPVLISQKIRLGESPLGLIERVAMIYRNLYRQKKIVIQTIFEIFECILIWNNEYANNLYLQLLDDVGNVQDLQVILKNLILIDYKNDKVVKKVEQMLMKDGIQIYEGTYQYLKMKNKRFCDIQFYDFKYANFNRGLLLKIEKLFNKVGVQTILITKYGHKVLKVDQNYLVVSERNYNSVLEQRLLDYYATILQTHVSNIKIVYDGNRINFMYEAQRFMLHLEQGLLGIYDRELIKRKKVQNLFLKNASYVNRFQVDGFYYNDITIEKISANV